MISHLEGIISKKIPPNVYLTVNNVTYEIWVPMTVFEHLPTVGSSIKLCTVLLIREDSHTLYGFLHEAEKTCFNELIKVSGIGAKIALAMMSTLSPQHLATAIANEDINKICNTPGIGAKTAKRVVLELQNSTKLMAMRGADEQQPPSAALGIIEDAIAALVALGYAKAKAEKTVHEIQKNNPDLGISELIKQSLQYIN